MRIQDKLWDVSNKLRGTLDANDFKVYVLSFLAYRYISDHNDILNCLEPNELICEASARLKHEKATDVLPHIFAKLNNIPDIQGCFADLDLSPTKFANSIDLTNERLSSLLELFANLVLEQGKDVLGDAYEGLMHMYATRAGKSGGEFYTPVCVSELLSKIALSVMPQAQTAYDPTAGAGSLLIEATKQNPNLKLYGQEINFKSYNVARLNLFLHGALFDIQLGDTLREPKHLDKRFDLVLSNPPYSVPWDNKAKELKTDPRFNELLAPASKGDYAFVQHALYHLKDKGFACIVVAPGLLYRSGAEGKIREALMPHFYACILLPSNLFYGTSIPTSIMVLAKEPCPDVLLIDATKECELQGQQNILTKDNQARILNALLERKSVIDFAALVDKAAFKESGDSTLTPTRFITRSEPEKSKIDIKALNREIMRLHQQSNELREQIDRDLKALFPDDFDFDETIAPPVANKVLKDAADNDDFPLFKDIDL